MTLLWVTLVALGFGFGSAWVPVLNAEAYVLVAAATAGSLTAWAVVGAVSVGQAAGKVAMFVAVRRGREWARAKPRRPRVGELPVWRTRIADWGTRGIAMLDRPWPAAGVITLAASVGIPPLAVVTVAAGARRTGVLLFSGCTLLGRAARFAVLAAPVLAAR